MENKLIKELSPEELVKCLGGDYFVIAAVITTFYTCWSWGVSIGSGLRAMGY